MSFLLQQIFIVVSFLKFVIFILHAHKKIMHVGTS